MVVCEMESVPVSEPLKYVPSIDTLLACSLPVPAIPKWAVLPEMPPYGGAPANCTEVARLPKPDASEPPSARTPQEPGPATPRSIPPTTWALASKEPMANHAHTKPTLAKRSEEHTSELQSLRHLVCR